MTILLAGPVGGSVAAIEDAIHPRRADLRRPVRQASLAAQTEQILRQHLLDGELAPGDRLPPEHDLARRFGVSRATVRTAVGSLARRGLVVQRHGVGTFVAAGTLLTNNLSEAVDVNVLLERGGAQVEVTFDEMSITPVPPEAAEALGVDVGASVLKAAKRFTADGDTLIYVVNSIPVAVLGAEIAASAARHPHTTEPLFDFLENVVGVSTAFQLASLEAVLGSDVEYPANELTAAVPVLLFEEVGYTNDNEPIWHSRNWFPPSAMRFELIRHRSGATP
ncbi:MAG: GntR family transcriptional regulator [Acidimicrobiales bacterium]